MDGVVRITNYFEHPENSRYMVYSFFLEEHADYFQSLLEDRQVPFERHLETEGKRDQILFGVEKRFLKESNRCNFLTHAHFRSPLIKSKWLGLIMIVITFSVVLLALIGYLKTR